MHFEVEARVYCVIDRVYPEPEITLSEYMEIRMSIDLPVAHDKGVATPFLAQYILQEVGTL